MIATSPKHAVELLDRAFAQGDLDAVLSFYEDAAVVITEPGRAARGTAELRSFFARAMQSGSSAKQLQTQVIEADASLAAYAHSPAQECHATPREWSVILSPSVMTTGSTASRKAYSMSLLTMTHQGSCCTTPLQMVQQAAALYLLETCQTSCNCFSDSFSSSAPEFISRHPLHGVYPPHGCGARL